MYGVNSDFEHRNVAIYARVSTDHEAQLSALENQIDWYKPILAARPNWTLMAQYIDEGITGTSAKKRPQFMKMIKDAKAKKFNMIITREVSRFARNTVDTLQYTRMLKEHGVEVFFINDNIKTFDGDGELRLTIMATLAQDESRKTSIRAKAGQQTSMEKGVFYGKGNILRDDRVGKDLVINPEQAETVRMIFDLYLSGMGVTSIQYELEKKGRLTASGKTKWFAATVAHTLRNSFYAGIITYHKEYVPDYLTQKKVINHGAIEKTIVKGSHTPIVTEEEYYRVCDMMQKRRNMIVGKDGNKRANGMRPRKTVWGNLLICECGNHFNLHSDNRGDLRERNSYQCYTAVNKGSKAERERRNLPVDNMCESPFIPEWKLDLMAVHIFKKYIGDASSIVLIAEKMLKKHISDQEIKRSFDEVISRKQNEIKKLQDKLSNLIDMRADGDISKERFLAKKTEITDRIDKLAVEVEELVSNNNPKDVIRDYSKDMKMLVEKLRNYCEFDGDKIPESLVAGFFRQILVKKDEFQWYFRTDEEGEPERERSHYKLAEFTITMDDAREYRRKLSPKKQVRRWVDLNVSLWI